MSPGASRQVGLQIEGELSIYRADELKRDMSEPLHRDVRLVVNLAAFFGDHRVIPPGTAS